MCRLISPTRTNNETGGNGSKPASKPTFSGTRTSKPQSPALGCTKEITEELGWPFPDKRPGLTSILTGITLAGEYVWDKACGCTGRIDSSPFFDAKRRDLYSL